MPFTLKKSCRRVLTFGRTLADTLKSKLSSPTFSTKQTSCSPFGPHQMHSPPNPLDISRPRHLKRAPIPPFHVQIHFIHRLPLEILAHIFVLGSLDDPMFPVFVSHVCRTWRQLALQTPRLWRQVTLTIPDHHMWRERIHRAKACSLDVRLIPRRQCRGGLIKSQLLDVYTVQWYMHVAQSYINRWRSLEISFVEYSPYLWNAALSGCCSHNGSRALLLEELTLVYRANDDTKEFCLFSGYAPKLRRLTVDGIRLTWLPSLFGNLTFLDYTHHGFTRGQEAVSDVLTMLTFSARLNELRILFPQKRSLPDVCEAQPQHTLAPTSLPHLTHLQLKVDGSDIPFELAQLVNLMHTPLLTSLQLVDVCLGFHAFPNLKSFFYVYALPPSLSMVEINDGWYDPRMVSPMVHALPLMRQIIIRRPFMPNQILNINPRSRKGSIWRGASFHGHFHIHSLDVRYLHKR
ncbi:hypothetical protein BDQ17DRAFT_1419580 [Cyathus striatus]|nr:hypothetical protein BDQ17DRAFT_1419580 [Cyathus striatus]